MGSTFGSVNTSLSALHAQRRGMDVTGQNIANANTVGYSRQRVEMAAVGGAPVPALWSRSDGADGGVAVTDVRRLRDQFLETRARTEHGRSAALLAEQAVLTRIETSLGEPGDNGLGTSLSDLWEGFANLESQPGERAPRSALLGRAATLADGVNAAHASLTSVWTSARDQLDTVADQAGSTARAVAELNRAVQAATRAGTPANELADQRDVLVLELAELTGARAQAGTDGAVDVYLGATALVAGGVARGLTVTGAATMAGATTDPPQLAWADSGAPVTGVGGHGGGLLTATGATVPQFAGRLDQLAVQLRDRVNTAHRAGYDLNGAPGADLFTGGGAADLALAVTDTDLVAVSESPTNRLGGGNADALAGIGTERDGPDRAYQRLVVDLGVAAQTVNRRVDIQTAVVTRLDADREAQSGVNLDEEMVNMLAFQRAFEGASRMLTAVDSTLDTLINRTGLVGR